MFLSENVDLCLFWPQGFFLSEAGEISRKIYIKVFGVRVLGASRRRGTRISPFVTYSWQGYLSKGERKRTAFSRGTQYQYFYQISCENNHRDLYFYSC